MHCQHQQQCFASTAELQKAVDEYLADNSANLSVALKYGWPIGSWCVSNIQDFSSLFSYRRKPVLIMFDEDISGWDTSNAVTMSSMFAGTLCIRHTFSRANLSAWDVSRVTDMSEMFYNADAFNRDLSRWNVSNVIDMSFMFSGADSFNQSLCTWGQQIAASATVDSMFVDTACLIREDPQPAASGGSSAFCHPCSSY